MKAIINKTESIKGTIEISGSKNATLPLIACALLTKEKVILKNVPYIKDIEIMIEILKQLKVNVFRSHKDLIIQNKYGIKKNLLISQMKELRGSTYLIASLIARKKKLKSFLTGGCNLGPRPIDYHLKGFKDLGITSTIKDEILILKRKKLKGNIIELPGVSLGATINMLIVSVLAKGQTIIKNPSLEPEVLETITFLNSMGAKIWLEQNEIRVKGVKKLYSVCHKVMFDRMEAGSYLLLGASFPNSMLTLTNVSCKYLNSILDVLEKMGVEVISDTYKITIKTKEILNSIDIVADIYPFFPTDLQQIYASLSLNTNNPTKITDLIFPKRLAHLEQFKKLGANVCQKDNYYLIEKSELIGTTIEGIDLRGTFALIVAGAHASGTTIINDIDNVLRGYEYLEYKLRKIKIAIKIEKH